MAVRAHGSWFNSHMQAQSLFISHGAPDLLISDHPARDFLTGLGASMARPEAFLVISAHWYQSKPTLNAIASPETIHDFHGFPKALYEISYPASGSPMLAKRWADRLREDGHEVLLDWERGLDHGAWAPLSLMRPEADVPVIQLSVPSRATPAELFSLGSSLAPLRDEGVCVLGSGGSVHNLRALREPGSSPEVWATGFSDWLTRQVETGELEDAMAFQSGSEHAAQAHPMDDHLRPLFVAWGAGATRGERIHSSYMYGNIAMDCYRF